MSLMTAPADQTPYRLENKEKNVQEMFSSIAGKYDLNNTLLSLGLHARWKTVLVNAAALRENARVLDIASGTGDIAVKLARKFHQGGKIVSSDLNREMLLVGKEKITLKGLSSQIAIARGKAEELQFKSGVFDLVTVGFGVRNFTDIPAALAEVCRVLKPGGQFLCLEFSKPVHPVWQKLYDFYSYLFLPRVGKWISGDKTGVYNYLPDSIRKFPDQETFKGFMEKAGLVNCSYRNLSGGIVAIHSGFKP